jgi:hypothetical protein
VDFFDRRNLVRTVVDALERPREEFAPIMAAARETIVRRYDRESVCLPRLVELVERLAPGGAPAQPHHSKVDA